MKEILFGKDARNKIKEGINKCCDVIKVSMGNNGKNVLIYNGSLTDIINDGVSIVRAIDVKDEVEQAGIMLAKQCASKTNNAAGDGTTTTLVLLQSLINELISDTQLISSRELRKQIQEANILVQEKLDEVSKKISSIDDIEKIATTSSLDSEIGKLIAEIYEKLGENANIIIEETERDILEKEIVEGIQFSSKNVALYSDESEQYYDIPLIVFKTKFEAEELAKKLQVLASNGDMEAVVVAPQWDKTALTLITQFKMKGTFKVAAVKNLDTNIEDVEAIGNRVSKVIITSENTTLIGGNGNVTDYIEKLKEKLEKEESKYNKELLKKRISFLSGGIGIIHIGKPTDVERHEYVLKIEDAINAAKSAYDGGFVIGAGITLSKIGNELFSSPKNEGERIMKEVCSSPMKQILENSGLESFVDIDLNNVYDSVKVIKSALTNAISTATSILTAEAALIERNDS